jgi:Holliday junction resolvase
MVFAKVKGYRVERKIRKIFENHGWKVVRAGGSLGEADLVCIKGGKCLLFQIKSKKAETLYYSGYMKSRLEGFPFYIIVDFGYGNIRVVKPKKIIRKGEGVELENFLKKINIK